VDFLETNRSTCLKLQNVSGVCGLTSRTFITETQVDPGHTIAATRTLYARRPKATNEKFPGATHRHSGIEGIVNAEDAKFEPGEHADLAGNGSGMGLGVHRACWVRFFSFVVPAPPFAQDQHRL